ncbi:CoA-transferase family III [Xylaria sp. CBS 124048]|nr:CoA-transferase family III [Xylaria sp. CBS 124048]
MSLRLPSQRWVRPVKSHLTPAFETLQSRGASACPTNQRIYFKINRKSPSQRANFSTFSTIDTSHLPLDGITVVSLEQAIAAPFCTRQLADLGARVIKVERPGVGDFARAYDTRVNGLASHFVWTNRSKESLALDLKREKDLNVLRQLLKKADVLVQNLAPGATDRLGISYAKLKGEHPALIAYDLLVQSEAGMLSVTGTETEPAKVGISIADIASAMYAYTGILAALMKRSKTGNGSRVDISMLEAMAEWMSFPMYYAYNGQSPPKPNGAAHTSIYPYGPFETGGGGSIMLGVQNEREWLKLCTEVLELPALATNPRFVNNSLRSENRVELKKIICNVFTSMSVEEVLLRLDKARIANAQIKDMQGLWGHEQLQARGRWTEVETPNGMIPVLLPPGIASPAEVRMAKIPRVGEHNTKILAELGLGR